MHNLAENMFEDRLRIPNIEYFRIEIKFEGEFTILVQLRYNVILAHFEVSQ